MALDVLCPQCGRSLWVPTAQFGRRVVCPRCRYEWVAEPDERDRRDARDDDEDDRPRRRPRDTVEEAPRRDVLPARGGLVLTLGILSLCLAFVAPLGILLGLAAWVMGQGDLGRIKRQEIDPEGYTMTMGGLVTGILGLVLSVLFLITCAGMWSAIYSYRPGRWNAAPRPPIVAPPVPAKPVPPDPFEP